MTRIPVLIIAMLLSTSLGAAQAPAGHDAHHPAAKDAAMTEGEVRKIDKDAAKITIRHGPIANLDMPAMTMVFQVKDKALLEQVKTGDKIRFQAEKVSGGYAVTRVEAAK